jgi:hypothetical protein
MVDMASGTASIPDIGSRKRFVPTARSRKRDHQFFNAMAFAISAGVFAGFTRTYFARSLFHSPVIPMWVEIHGAVFTAWILFYLLQNLLAMNGGMKLHRRLGIVGVILAPMVVFLGLAVTLRQARQGRFFPFPDAASLVAVSTAQMLLFACFITTGLLLRRDGETHKRLILMSAQLFFFPAFGRLLHGINPTTLLLALCFYFAGPIYDLITRRSIHPAYRLGVPLLVLTMPPFTGMASQLPAWRHLVAMLLS